MMTSLVSALHSIVRDDGSADIIKRRTELDALVAELLPSEIRFLKGGLHNVTFVRDFIPDLPVEIRIWITEYLDLSDLITVRFVSRRWYESWAHVSICNKLMKQYFRSMFENTYMPLSDEEKPAAFMAASDRLHSMRKGEYHSMAILRYEHSDEELGEPSPVFDRQYNSGRIAWTIDGGIKVSTICTGVTTSYMMPNRERPQIWTLSGEFVVAGTWDKAVLHAWNLDSEMSHFVRLPSTPTKNISILGQKVGIVTSKKEVFIWSIGDSLHQLKIIDPTPIHRGFRELAVLFHPDRTDIVFVIFLSCRKVDEDAEVTGTVQWNVQKYLHGRLAKTYKMEYPLEGLDYRSGDEPGEVFCLNPTKIDENGLYSLGPVPVDFASRFLDLGCHHHWDRWDRRAGHRHLAHNITFNIYGERLSTCFYHLPGGQKDAEHINFVIPQEGDRPLKENLHLWGGQIFLPVVKLLDSVALRDPLYKPPVKRVLLVAIKSCDQISGPPENIRYIAGYSPPKFEWKTRGRFATRDLGVVYCWVGDPYLAQSLPQGSLPGNEHDNVDREVRGDGTFVVLFGEYDYVVWCYDRDIRLPDQP